MALYGRLFRYRSRIDKVPLENFLTEAVADLLTRMQSADAAAFLNDAFERTSHPDFHRILSCENVEWRTQVAMPGGIADLVLFVATRPVLVIESKTWSGYRNHDNGNDEANQLTTYCSWLARTAAAKEECAILLLTGTNVAPKGFHEKHGSYDVDCRAQITWAELSRGFNRTLWSYEGERQTWHDLAVELIEFLKEHKLSSEIYEPFDASATHLFIPSMERWQATFESIWSCQTDESSSFLQKKRSGIQISAEGGLMWQWRYALKETRLSP